MTRIKKTFVFADTGTELTHTVDENGVATIMFLVVPAMTGIAVTATVSVIDTDSHTIWTDSARNEGANYLIGSLGIPLDYGYTIKVTLDKAAGAGGASVIVKFYVEQRK